MVRRAVLLGAAILASCGGGQAGVIAGQEVTVAVTPSDVDVAPGGGIRFSAAVSATLDTGVTWSIDQGSAGGTITAGGLYTAPGGVGTFTIRAVSKADPSKAGTATATVTSGTPVAATPQLAPGATSSSNPITVAITCPSAGTSSYYTTDGSAPSTSSTQGASVTFGASGTLRAVCAGGGFSTSAVASATYTITSGGGASGAWVTSSGAACTNDGSTSCEYQPCQQEAWHTGQSTCGASGTAACRVWYVCSTGGSDSNPGTDNKLPKASLGAALSLIGQASPGDTIAFCRGGSWSGSLNLGSTSGTAANPIVVRDYGTGARPIINGTMSLSGTAGVRILSIDLNENGAAQSQITGGAHDNSFCSMVIRGASGTGIYNQASPNQHVMGCVFRDNRSIGWLSDGSGVQVENSFFWNNGSNGASTDHSIYFGGSNESDNEVIRGNVIYSPAGGSGPVAIVVHGKHSGGLVERNTVQPMPGVTPAAGSWGISTMCGYSCDTNEYVQNMTFRGNTVMNMGNSFMHIEQCQNCLIEDNLIINTAQAGAQGIVAASNSNGGRTPANNTVRNNTVYSTAGGTAFAMGSAGTGHILANNVAQTSGTCYGGSGTGFTERDYNAYYQCGDSVVGSHSWKNNPDFVTAGSNFHPANPGSPLIGAGDPNQVPASDITGTQRPSPPSMGAYEP